MKSIKRRTFLKAGATAAMAAAVVPVQAAEPVSTVVVVHGEDIPKMIAAGIAKMGGWEKFVKTGAKVALVARRDEVAAELEKRYRDQRFLADRAINLGDWATAQRELRVLCDLVPDAKDPRHAEASAKLLDVEGRIKKGAR